MKASTLTFSAFRAANVARCAKWHPQGIASWSPADWLTAVTGELGELASLLKMRNRERDGLPGNKFSPTDQQVANELADVLTYLDLLAEVLGVDLGHAAASKFNEVSERVGFPDRIDLDKLHHPGGYGVQLAHTRERRIYVAGPMSGMPEHNFPAFHIKAAELRAQGWHVENPAEHGVVEDAAWADYLHYDLTRLATCQAMYLLPGWSSSRGARLEVYIARALGMVIHGVEDVEAFDIGASA